MDQIVTLGLSLGGGQEFCVEKDVTSLPFGSSFCFHPSPHPRAFVARSPPLPINSLLDLFSHRHSSSFRSQRPSLSLSLARNHCHPTFISFVDCRMTFRTTDLQKNGFFLSQRIGIMGPNGSLNISLSAKIFLTNKGL